MENIQLGVATGIDTSPLAQRGKQLAADLIGETVLYPLALDAFVMGG